MTNNAREVMAEVFEFLLSLFIIGGAGFLLAKGIANELASGVITLVTGYWFQRRSNEAAVQTLLRQSPTVVPIRNEQSIVEPTPPEVPIVGAQGGANRE